MSFRRREGHSRTSRLAGRSRDTRLTWVKSQAPSQASDGAAPGAYARTDTLSWVRLWNNPRRGPSGGTAVVMPL
jgi:hypothetical protein